MPARNHSRNAELASPNLQELTEKYELYIEC